MDTVIFKIHQLWGQSFFWYCSNFNLNFENAEKILENVFRFWDSCIWKSCYNLSLLRREYLSSAVNDFAYHSDRLFPPELLSQRSLNMVKKMLSFRFPQCFNPFTMLLVEGSSEMVLFRHLCNQFFRSP